MPDTELPGLVYRALPLVSPWADSINVSGVVPVFVTLPPLRPRDCTGDVPDEIPATVEPAPPEQVTPQNDVLPPTVAEFDADA
ncbi:hypothetical protein DTY83_08930 [Shigella sonnei]|nr:hypothetical protein [Shigella sonnei]EGE4396213.1 hypothetical protein [Shigella sonnei]